MKKKLQIHVLENVRDNGGWVWAIGPAIANNEEADKRVEKAGYSISEYYNCTVSLIEDGKIVDSLPMPMLTSEGSTGPLPRRSSNPECLTIEGYKYINRLKHPVRHWLKQNWFPATIAIATILASLASIAIEIASKLID